MTTERAIIEINNAKTNSSKSSKAAKLAIFLAEQANLGFSSKTLTYHLDRITQQGAVFDKNSALELAKNNARKIDPSRNLNAFKAYAKQSGIDIDFRKFAYMENHNGLKPTYPANYGEIIAQVISTIFSGYDGLVSKRS